MDGSVKQTKERPDQRGKARKKSGLGLMIVFSSVLCVLVRKALYSNFLHRQIQRVGKSIELTLRTTVVVVGVFLPTWLRMRLGKLYDQHRGRVRLKMLKSLVISGTYIACVRRLDASQYPSAHLDHVFHRK